MDWTVFTRMTPENLVGIIAFAIIAVAGALGNMRLLKAELGKDFEKFKNDIRNDIGLSKEKQKSVEDKFDEIESRIASIDNLCNNVATSNITVSENMKAVLSLIEGFEKTFNDEQCKTKEELETIKKHSLDNTHIYAIVSNISNDISAMKKDIHKHSELLRAYESYKDFRKLIRSIFAGATEQYSGVTVKTASEYLCFVCEEVLHFIGNVEKEGFEIITEQSFETMIGEGLSKCQKKFLSLYNTKKANEYFTSEMSVFRYKEDILRILADKNKANHVKDRYVTATIRWCQELVANFMNVVIIGKGE